MDNGASKITVEKLAGFYQWLSTLYSDIQKIRYNVVFAPDQYFTDEECAWQFKDGIDRQLKHLLDGLKNQRRKCHELALGQEKEDEEEGND